MKRIRHYLAPIANAAFVLGVLAVTGFISLEAFTSISATV